MFRDYFVLFSYPEFYGKQNCSEVFDADIAGRGVVSSLTITAVLTTILALCAPFLDGIAGYGLTGGPPGKEGVLPRRLNYWLFRRYSEQARTRANFYRKVLNRVMITLGDQQILTGIAILVSGYVRAAQNEQADQFPRWRYRLIENHFFLIVYLACLSSSSHLAAVITLKSYLNENKVPAFMRLGLIVTFAILLTVTICLAVPFGPPTILFLTLDQDISWKERYCRDYVQASYGTDCSISADRFLLVLFYIVTTVAVLYPYWIAIINTFENWRAALKGHIKTFWRIDTRWLPMHWIRKSFDGMEKVGPRKFWKWLRRRLKSTFIFLVLGNTGRAFYLQLIFFAISLMYVIAQRVANTPREDVGMCDLSSGGTSWGFGQILPMLLLAFPVISAVVAYFEVKKEVETCKSKDESSEDKVSNADDNV